VQKGGTLKKPTPWVGFLSVPTQGQTEREESCSLAELCSATDCELLNPLSSCEAKTVHSGALGPWEGIPQRTNNGILQWTSLFLTLDHHGHSCTLAATERAGTRNDVTAKGRDQECP
jgi:hypothetical protein